jgi:4,5-DOPA dioxygenase extradiol
MTAFPTLFVSHGAPDLVARENPARDFFARYGAELCQERGRPQAILVVSAHFDMKVPSLSADEKPGRLFDFQGFDEGLYRLVYPAPGLPELASVAATLIESYGFPVQEIVGRGLDHGVFIPLLVLFPQADIPVVQMAIQGDQGAGHHIALGRALSPLRQHGVLLIGSGSLTHNFEAFAGKDLDAPVQSEAQAFADWVKERAEAGAIDDIADYRTLAPFAQENHPTEDHFLPFAFAFGAAGEGAKGRRIHHSVERGAMVMDAYAFG